jgi:hypothetical protein
MTKFFKVLSDEEFDQLKDAIALITVYIAGADGEIHDDEVKWAKKITFIRSFSTPNGLKEFYKEVDLDFHDRVEKYMVTLNELKSRNATVEKKLAALNPILSKLDPKIGAALYSSYTSFAQHVAKATGGFLGFFSIDAAEKELLDLKMIDPIIWEDDYPLKYE